jgi:peptidoglycan hydrolase CwlO-like protein
MKFIKKNLLITMLFTLLFSVSNITVFADSNDYLQKGMTPEQKAMHEYNVKMYNQIKGEVDAQSDKIKEQVQQQQRMSPSAEDIHKEAQKIKSISTMILIITPIFWIAVIVIIICAIRHFLKRSRTKITSK